MTTDLSLPKGIGPHEGRELELMLAGTKPLAIFSSEPVTGYVPEGLGLFTPHIASGSIINVNVARADGKIIRHYFCLPGEEWRIQLMEYVTESDSHCGLSSEDWHRMDGALLGYTREEVEAFISHTRRG